MNHIKQIFFLFSYGLILLSCKEDIDFNYYYIENKLVNSILTVRVDANLKDVRLVNTVYEVEPGERQLLFISESEILEMEQLSDSCVSDGIEMLKFVVEIDGTQLNKPLFEIKLWNLEDMYQWGHLHTLSIDNKMIL